MHVPTREELSHQLLARPETKPQLSRAEPATIDPSHFYRRTLEWKSGRGEEKGDERERERRDYRALLRA